MSYIGRGLQSGAFRQLDDISSGFDGSDTTHTMQVNSTNVTVGDVNQILLSLGGVIQKPGTDFTVSSSTLTFTTAPAANTSFFAVLLGSDNGGTVTPTDASVTNDKISSALTTIAGLTSAGAAGTATSVAGIPFFQGDTGSIYTHDVSGTDSTAQYNTAYGLTAMDAITTGDQNTSIGYGAGGANQTGAEQVNIGYQAGLVCTSSGNVLIGKDAGLSITSGEADIHIGVRAGDGYDTESNNVSIGVDSLGGSIAGGEYNTAVGNFTLDALTSADYCVAIGNNAGSAITTGGKHILIGHNAGSGLTTSAGSCVYIGTGAGSGAGNDTERFNIGIGEDTIGAAGNTINGAEYNTAVGALVLDALTTGDSNTAVGYGAGTSVTTGPRNTLIGEGSGGSITEGEGNVCVGQNSGNAGTSCTTGSNNIFIGEKISAGTNSNNNQIVIGSEGTTGKGTNTGFISPNGGGMYNGANSTAWSTVSDRRIKKNIEDNNIGLEAIDKIRVRNFEYRTAEEIIDDLPKTEAVDKQGIQLGVIAQEIEEVLPDVVTTETTGVKTIDVDNLTWYLINAVKELSAEIKVLKEEK